VLDGKLDGVGDFGFVCYVGADGEALRMLGRMGCVCSVERERTSVPYCWTFAFPVAKVASSWMSTRTMPRAPSLAKDTAMALPRPRAPPVMNATPGAMGPDRFDMMIGGWR
jgi:hypothetical protein